MKRYFSHYTFIYPDIYLRNHVVEISDDMKQISFFPFDREIERTEFYSGLLIFIPENTSDKTDFIISKVKSAMITAAIYSGNTHIQSDTCFNLYHEENV
ncbi:hypothetical protein [uncultured Dysgonomonas sp.]|uniref:Uncharacterized protein n=1 Tax=uncultured Dysgonomonas sp. TaxID=206096 RepID=A0A212K2D4_9BACT|nr:hypothetical protein [uncultured Dysgonomonas sp.]SBW05884.1 conserved hypothetical protein [uncultured Dysgonomonas sp.]